MFGKPEDVAELCVYLASDESSWLRGTAVTLRRRIHGHIIATLKMEAEDMRLIPKEFKQFSFKVMLRAAVGVVAGGYLLRAMAMDEPRDPGQLYVAWLLRGAFGAVFVIGLLVLLSQLVFLVAPRD